MQAGVQGILSLLGTGPFSGGLSGTPGLYLPPLPNLSFLLWNPTSLSLYPLSHPTKKCQLRLGPYMMVINYQNYMGVLKSQ